MVFIFSVLGINQSLMAMNTNSKFSCVLKRAYYQMIPSKKIWHYCKDGNYTGVEEALKYGADINGICLFKGAMCGQTPLYIAIRFDNVDIVRLLLDKGADVNNKSNQLSLLELAYRCNNFVIVKLLIDRGADVKENFFHDDSLLNYAIKRNDFTFAQLLVDKGHSLDINPFMYGDGRDIYGGQMPLETAISCGNIEMIKLLISKSPGHLSTYGIDLVQTALRSQRLDVLKLLIDHKVDIQGEKDDMSDDWGLLSQTIQAGEFEAFDLLLMGGVYVDQVGEFRFTPLHLVVLHDQPMLIKKLLWFKARIDLKDHKGLTAVDHAKDNETKDLLTSPHSHKPNQEDIECFNMLVLKAADNSKELVHQPINFDYHDMHIKYLKN